MKKILFRKLLLDYLVFFLIALMSTSVVIWVFQAVNYLDIMIEDGRDYLIYVKFSLLNFPKIVSKLYPFVLFFTIFYVTVKYELNNELIIFWNHGVNKIQIINIVFVFSIVLLIVQILLTSLIVPKAQDIARSFLRLSTVNFLDNFIKQQKFNDTIKGITIYSDKKDKNGNLTNIYLKKEFGNKEFQITYAKSGKFKQIGSIPILVLNQGATITSKNNEITNISFSKSDFSLANLETNTATYIKTQELSSYKIIKCINNFYKYNKTEFDQKNKSIENCSLKNINNIFKEFYKRFIIPIYIPLLSLIPLILIASSKENQKYNRLRLHTFLTGFVIIILSESISKFITENLNNNFLFLLIPLVLMIILYFYFIFNFKFRFKS